jgi:hypothetical protein
MHAKPSSKPEIQQAGANAHVLRDLLFRLVSIVARTEHPGKKVLFAGEGPGRSLILSGVSTDIHKSVAR